MQMSSKKCTFINNDAKRVMILQINLYIGEKNYGISS